MSARAAVILTAVSAGVGQDELVTLLAGKAPASTVVDVHQGGARRIGTAHHLRRRVMHLRARPGVIHDLHPLYNLVAEGCTIVAVRPALSDTFASWLEECGGPDIFEDLGLDLRAGVLMARGRGHDKHAKRQAQRLAKSLPVSRPPLVVRNDVHGVDPRHHVTSVLAAPGARPHDGELDIPFAGRAVLQRAARARIGPCESAALGEEALKTWPPETREALLRWGHAVETALTPLVPAAWRAHASGGTRVVNAPSRELRQRARARRRAAKLQQLLALLRDPDVARAGWEATMAWLRPRVRRLRRRLAVRLRSRSRAPNVWLAELVSVATAKARRPQSRCKD